eukprot:GHVU01172641.1.p1 GENE.GHVU01172641.1~~GHVU01172641.1.p1  ORF type:complete len:122 (+),score=2.64 GHVU01172641.1:328-693(+)
MEKCFTAACSDRVKTLSIPLTGKLKMDHTGISNFILDVVTSQLKRLENTGKSCLKEIRLVLKQNNTKLQQVLLRYLIVSSCIKCGAICFCVVSEVAASATAAACNICQQCSPTLWHRFHLN